MVYNHPENTINNLDLYFSVSKCQFIRLNLVSDQPISHAEQLEYLGIVMDDKLTFTPHIKYVQKKFDDIYNKL